MSLGVCSTQGYFWRVGARNFGAVCTGKQQAAHGFVYSESVKEKTIFSSLSLSESSFLVPKKQFVFFSSLRFVLNPVTVETVEIARRCALDLVQALVILLLHLHHSYLN